MGLYINPPAASKENWLGSNAKLVKKSEFKFHDPHEGTISVCLVDNGPFTAALLCYIPQEVEVALRDDGRLKLFYELPMQKLAEIHPDIVTKILGGSEIVPDEPNAEEILAESPEDLTDEIEGDDAGERPGEEAI